MKFGLMFFAASEDSLGQDKYRLVVDSARFGDAEGFSSVWVPERHFTAFGGLYPNPAVLHAGLATCTTRIRLNAGSVVAPLHHPLRIAEEWSVVDNLSNGRVGLSFASGWNPNDFVFSPDRYATRHEQVFDTMQTVQQLWRGESFVGTNGVGQPATVQIFPKPVQPELPVWLTVAGNPAHFERAGRSGAHLLTHLLDQDEAVLASRIALYRNAREAAGFDPAGGIVSLMIHTFVGSDADTVREQARGPYCNYIKANIGLFKGLAQSRGRDADLSAMSPAALDEFVNFLYDRFAAERGLIGTPESCAPLAARLEKVGVSELACLLDFGPPVDQILAYLPHLARLKDLHESQSPSFAPPAPVLVFDRVAVQRRCSTELSGDAFHQQLAAHGILIDGAFQPPLTLWRRDGEALGKLALANGGDGYHVHPVSLDACGRVLAAALPDFGRPGGVSYVPTGFDSCDVDAPLTGTVWAHAVITARPADATISGDVVVYGESGHALARVAGLRFKPIHTQAAPAVPIERLLYERKWQPLAVSAQAIDVRGRWLVVPDATGVAAELSRLIVEHGGEALTVADGSPLRGILYLAGLDASITPESDIAALDRCQETAVGGALDLAKAPDSTPVWIVTRGAVAIHDTDLVQVAQSPLWGFGRALAVERPGRLGGLIDLDPSAITADAAHQLLSSITGAAGEDMRAFRSGTAFVPRLTSVVVDAAAAPIRFGPDDVVLLTGGAGGLGLRVIDWLMSRGARTLLVCSRNAPSIAAASAMQRWRSAGINIDAYQADVHDYAALQEQIGARASSITSIFHLAGVLDDGQLEEQTWDRFAAVFASKVGGAWNLHQLTREAQLKHFVLFSSVSSLMPAPGQSNYAAANAFLDGLAHFRRGLGLPATVINWGPWSDAGHASTDYGRAAHARLASLGIGSIAPETGMRALEASMQSGRTQTVSVAVDWSKLFHADPAAARLGLLANLSASATTPAATVRRGSSELIEMLSALPLDERRPYLLQQLSDMVIAALKLRTDEPIDARQRLFDVGLDSIMALELKDRLEQVLATELSATLLFVRPTLDALAEYILADLVPGAPVATTASSPSAMSEEELTSLLLREIDASRGA